MLADRRLNPLLFLLTVGVVVALLGRQAAAQDSNQGGNGILRHATRERSFRIPFSVAARQGSATVNLYTSSNQGKSWQLYAERQATSGFFEFHAQADGEYWFASRTITQATRKPPVIRQPELKIVVDTSLPQIELKAELMADNQIRLLWQASDTELVSGSVKLEFQIAKDTLWQPIPLDARSIRGNAQQQSGQQIWSSPISSQAIVFRLEARDAAGNLNSVNQRVEFSQKVGGPSAPATNASAPPSGLPVDPIAGFDRQPTAPRESTGSTWQPDQTAANQRTLSDEDTSPANTGFRPQQDFSQPPTDQIQPNGAQRPSTFPASPAVPNSNPGPRPEDLLAKNAPANSNKAPSNQGNQAWPQPVRSPVLPPVADNKAATNGGLPPHTAGGHFKPPAGQFNPQVGPTGPQPNQFAPRTNPARQPVTEQPAQPPANAPNNAALESPPQGQVQMASSRRFQLAYDVEAVGPSGVSKVELWYTQNNGRVWQKLAEDADRTSPMLVELQQDGTFGFQVVIVNGDGFAGRAPRAGDPAGIWIGVDTTAPTARLTSAQYGSGEKAGILDIHWSVTDQNLGERPITLYFSNAANGPWTPIATGLPNTGQYGWRADGRLPREVFLKLEARDVAGNTTTHRHEQPINLDGLAPKARIRGFSPLEEARRRALNRWTR